MPQCVSSSGHEQESKPLSAKSQAATSDAAECSQCFEDLNLGWSALRHCMWTSFEAIRKKEGTYDGGRAALQGGQVKGLKARQRGTAAGTLIVLAAVQCKPVSPHKSDTEQE